MNMQTGPAPRQSLDAWLRWTGIVEIANVGVFSFLWWILNGLLPGTQDILSILGLLTLDLILLEGGIYWLLVRARYFQKTSAPARYRMLRAVYVMNVLALLVFPAGLLRALQPGGVEFVDLLFGAGFYLFGLGEFLHYFAFKINMRPYEWRDALQNRRFVPARLLRELRRARVG
jgi:hypothetical protein